LVTRLLAGASEVRSYRRRSAVFFLGGREHIRDLKGVMVPFPIQDNLFALPKEIRTAALVEILEQGPIGDVGTMVTWLRQQFGSTFYRIFLEPFHERYTAGLFREIALQDGHKGPIDIAQAFGLESWVELRGRTTDPEELSEIIRSCEEQRGRRFAAAAALRDED